MKDNIVNSRYLDSSHREIILTELNNQAEITKKLSPMTPFAFSYFDDQNNFIAGIEGYDIYGGLYIDLLFVNNEHRKNGYGTKLVGKAIEFGTGLGCRFAYLSTMDFEAKPFYQKLGFEIEYIRQGYHNDSSMYYLKKQL